MVDTRHKAREGIPINPIKYFLAPRTNITVFYL